MQDAETMTLGMWVDYIIEYNNMHARAETKTDGSGQSIRSRRATQADFDNF